MSDDETKSATPAAPSAEAAAQPVKADATTGSANAQLDSIDDIDFLLEEIENKIAPLALA